MIIRACLGAAAACKAASNVGIDAFLSFGLFAGKPLTVQGVPLHRIDVGAGTCPVADWTLAPKAYATRETARERKKKRSSNQSFHGNS